MAEAGERRLKAALRTGATGYNPASVAVGSIMGGEFNVF